MNCKMSNKIILPKINSNFTRDDIKEYIKQFVEEDTYTPMYGPNYPAMTFYIYILRIPAIVTGREIYVKGRREETLKEDPFFPIAADDKFILERLKFGFRTSMKVDINKVVDIFLQSFDKVLKQGYTETIIENDEENDDTTLIRRTYIKKFIPIEFSKLEK